MAKKSSIEKNNRRAKLVKKYAGRRERLKAIANDKTLDIDERFEARLKLAEVPRNSSTTRLRNRCEITGRPRAFYRKMKHVAYRAPRTWFEGPDSRPCQVELVRSVDAMNDPLGDMLTRIRNAQMRRKNKVSTPGSRLRQNVLEVLKDEGYIRGYSTTDYGNGRTEFEIELKYYDGLPVIREIERVSKPGPPRLQRPSPPCRASPTASASPSSRRRRA